MNATAILPGQLRALGQFIRAELAPFPGRANTTLRLLITCALVITISMAYEIPYLALSLIAVFYTVQANVVLSRLVGIVVIVCLCVSIPLAVLLLKFTYDYPLLRILCASLVFFVSMFMIRVFKVGLMFLGVALVAIYVQTFADLTDFSDYLVTQIIWSCFALGYATVLALVLNTWFFPAEPLRQLQDEAHRQLDAAAYRLAQAAVGDVDVAPLSQQALQQGVVALQKLTLFTGMQNAKDYAGKLYRQACMTAVSRIQHLCNTLPVAFDAAQRNTLQRLSEQVRVLDSAIVADQLFHLAWTPTESERAVLQSLPQLADLYRTLLALDHFDTAQTTPDQPAVKESLFLPDAFTNPVYVRFAVKALACSLISYVFYNATQWQGIHTMMLTCGLVAYPTLGSSVRRIVLRFYGAVLGSIVALVLFIFVLPQLDSIVGLLLAVLPVIALGAWISLGAERSSYIGMQMVTTVALAMFEHFGPSSDLTVIRDRLIGIVLGTALCAVVYTLVWPESESTALREKLTGLLHALAKLIRPPAVADQAGAPLRNAQQHLQCWAQINTCDEMLERVAVEPQFQSGAAARLVQQANVLLAHSREILVAQNVLHHHALADLQTAAPDTHRTILALQAQAADVLDHYSDCITRAAVPPLAAQRQLLVAAQNLLLAQDTTDSASQSLLADAQRLAQHVANLPDWSTPPTGVAAIAEAV